MFQKMGKTALVVFFQDRAYLLRNVEICLIFGKFIVTDVISQAVFQLTDTDVRVGWKRGHLLGKCGGDTTEEQYGNDCSSE